MDKNWIKNNLLGFTDLQSRWGYQTVRGVRRRAQFDKQFPKPIKVLGNGAMIFWLPDIEAYEALRGEIDASQGRYAFYESKEEWKIKSREEREKQRGMKYSEDEWKEQVARHSR